MEANGNVPMPPPPPLPTSQPPPVSPAAPVMHLKSNGHAAPFDRQDHLSEIREGIKLKASRDQILHSSRTPNGGLGSDAALVSEGDDQERRLKKTVHSELQNKFDEIDSSSGPVLPSVINPDAPVIPPPLHIPMSTAIRVLQERERKESEVNQQRAASPIMSTTTPPQSRNGTLGRDGALSPAIGGEKLMISHGKRNFTTPKKITIKNENLVPKRNLLGGEGKMSRDLQKLLAADAEKVVEPPQHHLLASPTPATPPQIKSPQLRTSPDAFREKHLNSPDALEISNTLKRLISQDRVHTAQPAQVPSNFKPKVALPDDHQVSDQLKKLILEDMQKAEAPQTPVATNGYQRSSPAPLLTKPVMRHPKPSPISPSVKNGSMIDNNIILPLPPRVPSPPPVENPRKLSSQLSCDRLNNEFQEFNAYRAANPPCPKKIAIPLDPNAGPNFEKKTVVSFSQELAAPNRYPDTVKVVKTVQNGETIQKLALGNIKFVIDPENSENVVQVSM